MIDIDMDEVQHKNLLLVGDSDVLEALVAVLGHRDVRDVGVELGAGEKARRQFWGSRWRAMSQAMGGGRTSSLASSSSLRLRATRTRMRRCVLLWGEESQRCVRVARGRWNARRTEHRGTRRPG